MGNNFDCEKLAKTYGDYARPEIQILLNGRELKSGSGIYLEKAEITISCQTEPNIAALSCQVDKMNAGAVKSLEASLTLGAKVEIKTGYEGHMEMVFLGYLHELEVTSAQDDLAAYKLTCLDVKGLMRSIRSYATSGEKNAGQLVKEILGRSCYSSFIGSKRITDPPGSMNRLCVLEGRSDYEWMKELSLNLNYEFYVSGSTLFFRKSREDAGVLTQLSRDYGMQEVQACATMSGQTGSCEVRGFGRDGEKLSGKAPCSGRAGAFTGKLASLLSGSEKVYVDNSLETQAQALYRAKALATRSIQRSFCMKVLTLGLPELVPGRFIQVTDDLVPSLCGKLYVEEVTHFFGDEGYLVLLKGFR